MGSARLIALPSVHVWAAVWWASVGAVAGVLTAKISETERPLVSVAVTFRLRPAAVLDRKSVV